MSAPVIKRIPASKTLRETVELLRTGTGANILNSAVSGLSLRYVAKDGPSGPRKFAREIAPRLAYANPIVPFNIHRIRDPRSKSKDPRGPDAGAEWPGGEQPKPEMVIDFYDRPSQTLPLSQLSEVSILQQLLAIAGENAPKFIDSPSSSSSSSTSTSTSLDPGASSGSLPTSSESSESESLESSSQTTSKLAETTEPSISSTQGGSTPSI